LRGEKQQLEVRVKPYVDRRRSREERKMRKISRKEKSSETSNEGKELGSSGGDQGRTGSRDCKATTPGGERKG